MHEVAHGMRRSYQRGCRCDLCKCAESEYRRGLRQRQREEIGLVAGGDTAGMSLVAVPRDSALTSGNVEFQPANSVEAAVRAEIEALGSTARPGLVATAVVMARVLENPRAVSSQPPAARVLIAVLDKLRASSSTRRGNLALVRDMTKKGGA